MKLLNRIIQLSLILLIALLLFPGGRALAQEPEPVVHAIIFYSPTCPHCHQVMTQDLPPLVEKYGDQLLILSIDTSIPEGQALFVAAIEYYKIPSPQAVPTLVVGDTYLIGSADIPAQFPGIGQKSGGAFSQAPRQKKELERGLEPLTSSITSDISKLWSGAANNGYRTATNFGIARLLTSARPREIAALFSCFLYIDIIV